MVDFVKLYSEEDVEELRRQYNAYTRGESYEDFLFRQNCDLRHQKQQAIALIKDGRFVECLQLLEGK